MYGRRDGMRLCCDAVVVVFVDDGRGDGESRLGVMTRGEKRGRGVGVRGGSTGEEKEREEIGGRGR